MLIKKASAIRSSEITDSEIFSQRRTLLKAAAAAGVGAATVSGSAQALVRPEGKGKAISGLIQTPYGKGLQLTDYDDVTGYNNFYEFGTGKRDPAKNAHTLKPSPWTVRVEGECEAPGDIGMEEIFRLLPQEERIYRFRCVEAWSMVVPWVGFSLADLLKRFKPNSRARYVYFETLVDKQQMPGQRRQVLSWPYREALRIDEAMHPLTMLVTGVYGKELPNQNGAPLRLIVPWKYGFKSIKSIVKIRFVENLPETTWWKLAPKEYGFYANVNPQVDHPRWSQKHHRNIGEGLFAGKHKTELFNGYADEVADLYRGMDLKKFF